MRALIVSDTHRLDGLYQRLCKKYAPLDMVIHCGDVEGSEELIRESAGCMVQMVAGNNDYFSDLPKEKEFNIGKYKVWLTHGHNYYISMGTEVLKAEARARGVDIVMFGHTHKPLVSYSGDLILVNPGSLSYPRQEGRKPSYIIMETDKNGEPIFEIKYLP